MHEFLPQALFYIFAGLAILSAFCVVTQNNPVRCVLFLVLTFVASAVLWLLLQAEFLALILVLVYVGAVMTLFLFVVMMLNIDIESMHSKLLRYSPIGLLIVAILVGLLMVALQGQGVEPNTSADIYKANISNTEALGLVLYTDYVLALEIAAIILLVAIVAAITLVHRKPIRIKQQNIVKQIMTDSHTRITLLDPKPEESQG